jgi:hypothetical protein
MTNQTPLFTPPELVGGNVKTAMKSVGASSADLWKVKPSEIKFMDGFNLRQHNTEYEEHIEWLTSSIMQNGYYQDKPIAGYVATDDVNGQVIFCTDGHSRVTAALRAISRGAPIETVPMVIKPKGTTMEDLTFALFTSNEGRPFSPFEKGLAIKRLIDMGVDETVIAKRLGITVPYVNDLLTAVGAPRAVREMIASGAVSAATAVAQIKKHGSKATEKLQEAAKVAKASGKTKVTAKHLLKPSTLKLTGQIRADASEGASRISISLDLGLEVMLKAGSKVRLVITDVEDEL